MPSKVYTETEMSLMSQTAFRLEKQQKCSWPQALFISAHWDLYGHFLLRAPALGGGAHRGGGWQPPCSGKLPITLAVNFSIFPFPSANPDLWGPGCRRTVCDWVYCSLVENLLQINGKLFLKLLRPLVSVRQRFMALMGVVPQCRAAPWHRAPPGVWAPGEALGSPCTLLGEEQRARCYRPHVPKFCPSVSHRGLSATWGDARCCSFPSALFHLF